MSALSTLAQHVTRRPQRIALLAQIAELGSITRAAKAVGISYKGAWDAIDELNNLAERPLVERSVGGKGGGGARLTARANACWLSTGAWKPCKRRCCRPRKTPRTST